MDPFFAKDRPQFTGAIYRYEGNGWDTSAELYYSCMKITGSSPNNIWAISCEEIMRFDGFQWSTAYRIGDASEPDISHPGMIPRDICVGEEGTPLVLNHEGTIVFWEDGTWRDLEIPLESEEAEYGAGLITGSLSKSVYVVASARVASEGGESESTRIYQYRGGAWEVSLQVDGSKMGPIGQSEDGRVVNTQIRYPGEYIGQSSRVFLMRSGSWSEQGELGGMIRYQLVFTDDTIWLSNGDTIYRGLVEDGADR